MTQSHDSVSPRWHSTQTLTLRKSEVHYLYTYSQQVRQNCSNHFLHQSAPSLLVHTMPIHSKALWSEDENLTTNSVTKASGFRSCLYTNWYQRTVTMGRSILRLNDTNSIVPTVHRPCGVAKCLDFLIPISIRPYLTHTCRTVFPPCSDRVDMNRFKTVFSNSLHSPCGKQSCK